ncbi:MAG: DUF4384 domain-containing protein [Nitrospiraceae bacterium]|nr:DUF4384 domain-containing protein [Nitrospiraceae bacterium]
MTHPLPRRPWLLMGTSLLFSGCMALPFLIPPLVEFGANLLRTAVNNYGNAHEQNMEHLLVALQQPNNPMMSQGIIANPYGQPGGDQQTVYPGQGYQATQGYPAPQGYPSSPGYPQQPYDPYQNQQPQYAGNALPPNNPYPDQEQQGNPYSTNPVYPNQQVSVPGYSSAPQNQYPQQSQQANAYPNTQAMYPNQQNPYPNQAPNSNQLPETPQYQTAQPETAQTGPVPISLDVLLVKKHMVNGVQSYLPIKDGDILLDGRGNPQAGDKFRVMFRANTDCFVYVIAVDGTAWAQGIFPTASSPFANPIKAGQQYILPEGTNWFSLDQFKGIETIFVVASRAPRQDIEHILTTITGRERSPTEKPQAVSEPAIIPNGYSGARPGLSPFAFPAAQNQQQELLPTTYFVKTAGEDLRITRWFRHQ